VAEVGQRTCSSLRHLLRLFAMNPAACDAVLADASLADTRSESAAELIRQLKVYICNCYRGLKGDAENARHEIAGHENAAPECRGGKCET